MKRPLALLVLAAALAAPAALAGGPAPLQGEPGAATGDIPDNQMFLTYRDARDGYALRYPEGWARSRRGGAVTFRDRNNVVRVVVERGPLPSLRAVARELRRTRLTIRPLRIGLPAGRAIRLAYTTLGAPSPVTGKRVALAVDRYYVAGPRGRHAVVDLGTPAGVDNVDAYRLMIRSFRWR